jgi:hypothetical protein
MELCVQYTQPGVKSGLKANKVYTTIQYDVKQQRRVYSCVHYGKPANNRKITPNAVRKEIFNEMDGVDGNGTTLRQRQGLVSTYSGSNLTLNMIYIVPNSYTDSTGWV